MQEIEDYKLKAAAQRLEEENRMARLRNQELVQMQSEAEAKKEALRRATEEEINNQRRKTDEHRAMLERENMKARAQAGVCGVTVGIAHTHRTMRNSPFGWISVVCSYHRSPCDVVCIRRRCCAHCTVLYNGKRATQYFNGMFCVIWFCAHLPCLALPCWQRRRAVSCRSARTRTCTTGR